MKFDKPLAVQLPCCWALIGGKAKKKVVFKKHFERRIELGSEAWCILCNLDNTETRRELADSCSGLIDYLKHEMTD